VLFVLPGLIVVDTATAFTSLGKGIILVLIQVGALGIMTFAGLFAFAVTGASSLKSRLAFRDVMSGKEISNIMSFVYQVVMVTIVFEVLGAIGIYFSVPDELFPGRSIKFSLLCFIPYPHFAMLVFQPIPTACLNLPCVITTPCSFL
jgi:Trk-type K+ transport system membrane component